MAEPFEPKYSIRAVDRICDILDTLRASEEGVSLTEIAAAVRIPKSTALRYLASLERRNYVERASESGDFRLGLVFQPSDSRNIEALCRIAEPGLARLRDELEQTTNLGIVEAGQVVHLLVLESPQTMRLAARVGERGLIHSTALGKAICATMPEAEVINILTHFGMPSYTSATMTTPADYLAELERVRETGYAVDDAENQAGGRCVAVVIPELGLSAGVSVSAPASQLAADEVPRVASRLQRLAASVSEKYRESHSGTHLSEVSIAD